MIFYRCELRDYYSKACPFIDMHYADTIEDAILFCRMDYAKPNSGLHEHEIWIWVESTGYQPGITEHVLTFSGKTGDLCWPDRN